MSWGLIYTLRSLARHTTVEYMGVRKCVVRDIDLLSAADALERAEQLEAALAEAESRAKRMEDNWLTAAGETMGLLDRAERLEAALRHIIAESGDEPDSAEFARHIARAALEEKP